jgi:signal transduction histidine kinase
LKFLCPLSLIITPLIALAFPAIKDFAIASIEFCAESCLLIQVTLFCIHLKKNKKLNWGAVSFCISIFCIFFADSLYSARVINITYNYSLLSDCLYTFFSIFLALFLIQKLDISNRKFNEWGWIFLGTFIIDIFLSYWFLLSHYFAMNATLLDLISTITGTIYAVITAFIFALILPFAFRISNRSLYWLLSLLLLLLMADFSIRYHDVFINPATFPWTESIWCSTFIGLAWLVYFCQDKEKLLVSRNPELAPLISIRSLLTLAICGANILFLIGILFIKMYSFQTAIDISSVLFVLFVFWIIANEFSIWLASDLSFTLQNMFKAKEFLTTEGVIQFNLEKVTSQNPIFEISKILESYNSLVEQTNKIMNLVVEANKNASIAEIASQVSHDIRSPLAALEVAIKSIILPEEQRILIRSALGRIKDIANNLLQKNRNLSAKYALPDSPMDSEEKSSQLLSSLIEELISEKRLQFRAKINIEINSTIDEDAYGIFSEVNSREFKRLLSNLINNAVDSLNENGKVTVSLTKTKDLAQLTIVDNGCGIPPAILSRLGKRGESYGKTEGSGLGLYHAKTTVESWGGHLEINSTLKIGTSVTVVLPLSKPPYWLAEQLTIYTNSNVVILDDDISIHQIWDNRFEHLGAKDAQINLVHFSVPDQLITWFNKNKDNLSHSIFLVDYELIGLNQTGLDILELLKIESKSILVTSRHEDPRLISRCKALGVKLIPKSIAGFVPIAIKEVFKIDFVLIDDDPLVHQTWCICAEDQQKTVALFKTAEDFIAVKNKFANSVPIYIDVNLANG